MNNCNFSRRKTSVWIVRFDSRVIPLLDLAKENVGNYVWCKPQGLINPGKVVSNNHSSQNCRNVDDLRGSTLEILILHRRIRSTEVHSLFFNLLDAAA